MNQTFNLYDVVEMKKEHPCVNRTRLFQIVRMGADIKEVPIVYTLVGGETNSFFLPGSK